MLLRGSEEDSVEEDRVIQSSDAAKVVESLEAGQLASARAVHYPRRRIKTGEAVLLWSLRIYLLFMLGVVLVQIWQGAH